MTTDSGNCDECAFLGDVRNWEQVWTELMKMFVMPREVMLVENRSFDTAKQDCGSLDAPGVLSNWKWPTDCSQRNVRTTRGAKYEPASYLRDGLQK